MKLHEAIRLGAALKPQRKQGWVGDGSSSCALLAASEALGIPANLYMNGEYGVDYRALRRIYAFMDNLANCPECDKPEDIGCTIWHLNDTHDWDRIRIADWVQTIEDAQEENIGLNGMGHYVLREDLVESI